LYILNLVQSSIITLNHYFWSAHCQIRQMEVYKEIFIYIVVFEKSIIPVNAYFQ